MLLSLLRIHGHSMQPTIYNGQKVLISSLPFLFSKPKINDIVAFKLDSKIFVKRIRSVSESANVVANDPVVAAPVQPPPEYRPPVVVRQNPYPDAERMTLL